MCSLDDADPADVYCSVSRRAAKVHQCEECRRWIDKGEHYQYITMLFDQRWSAYRVCRHCMAAGQWLDLVCGGWLIGGLSEELGDHWDEGYRSHWLGRALIGIRSRWTRVGLLPDPKPLLQRQQLIP